MLGSLTANHLGHAFRARTRAPRQWASPNAERATQLSEQAVSGTLPQGDRVGN